MVQARNIRPAAESLAAPDKQNKAANEERKMTEFKVTRTTNPKAKPADESELGFGKVFSDSMFMMDYTEGRGWHDGRIVPYGPLELDPAAVVLHYAQELFEGQKAFRGPDGEIRIFRPIENVRRMASSCERICIPPVPEDVAIGPSRPLLKWTPTGSRRARELRSISGLS